MVDRDGETIVYPGRMLSISGKYDEELLLRQIGQKVIKASSFKDFYWLKEEF